MALSEDILKLKDVFNGANPLQAGMNQAGGTLQLPQAPAAQPPQGEGSLPVPPSIPTVNQGGVDVPISGDQLQKWQEWMRVKGGQGEASAPLSPAAPAPSSTIDPSSRIPQDMQKRIAGLNEVFARPNLVQNGSLATPAPSGAEFDFSGLPNVSDTGLSEKAFGRLSPTAQGSIIDVPTATEDRMTPTFQGMEAGGGQIAPEGMAPTIGPDGRAVFADRGTAQDLAEAELATQREDRAAQQRFLASPEAKEFSSRQLRSAIMGDGQFGRESAAREQRAAEQFGVPRGPDSRDRDRRGTMSKADAVKLTGGDRVAADALLKRQELGLGEFAPEKAGQTGLTPEQDLAERKFELDKAKFVDSVIAREGASAPLSPAQKKFAEEAGKGAYEWDQGGRAGAQENIQKFQTVLTDLEDGNLDTRTLTEFAPFVGDWARAAVNPTGQQGLDTIRGVIFQGLRDTLGAQFTEREGERLVSASYNPKLDEASNIARLKPALQRMRATFEAKEALTQHIMQGGSVQDYKGVTPMEAYQGKGQSRDASTQSPIEGDVNVTSEADKILSSL